MTERPLLEVEGLAVHYPVRRGRSRGVAKALDGVSLSVAPQEILGVVGESGSGKTTLGRAIVRLIEPTAGDIRFDGRSILGLGRREMLPVRRRMQIIFQDPSASLNPTMTVGEALGEAMIIHRLHPAKGRPEAIAALLDRVGLPRTAASRRPHELSGGQRQRVGIARALAVTPDFIIADEAVSALDVSVQAQIVNLLQDLQADLGLAMLFISHDLPVVAHLSDRVMVLYLGRVMELGPTETVLSAPRHPYTRALLEAEPSAEPGAPPGEPTLRGEPPSPLDPPPGCVFSTRCRHAEAACSRERPSLRAVAPGHLSACLRQEVIDL